MKEKVLFILKQFLIEFITNCLKVTTPKWVMELYDFSFQSSKFQWQNLNVFLHLEILNIGICFSLYKSNCKVTEGKCLH